jgi:hypothetical protein
MSAVDATSEGLTSIRFLLFGAILLMTSCSESDSAAPLPTAPTPPTDPVTVRVFGRVLDFTTNAGVPGASINFYVAGLDWIASSVVTDAGGRYSVSLSRGVRYDARINGPQPDSNRGTIMPVAKETEADYLINGGTCIVFHGSVRNALTGEPIGGAAVGFDRFQLQSTQTAADGSYRIELGCPTPANPWRAIGTTFMRVSRAGYATTSPYGNRGEFLPGARTQRIDVALQPAVN